MIDDLDVLLMALVTFAVCMVVVMAAGAVARELAVAACRAVLEV